MDCTMKDVIELISLMSLAAAIVLLALGVEKLHRYAALELLRLAAEVSSLRRQLRETAKEQCVAELCCAPAPTPGANVAEDGDFDVWLRERNEYAHREYMHRTSRLPICARLTYTADEITKFYGISHGGID
jgi:hypothetical protein